MLKILPILLLPICIYNCKTPSYPEKKSTSAFSVLHKSTPIIFQDSKNNYWFASDGVVRFDGKESRKFTKEDGLFSLQIRSIQEDHLGKIFIETVEGINYFDGRDMEKLKLNRDSVSEWKLEPNDLWFAGSWKGNGPIRFDGEQLHHLEFPKHKFHDEFYEEVSNPSFSPYEVYQVFKDSRGHIWLGTGNFGACRFDGNSLRWISEREMSEMDPGPAPGVRSIVEDLEGNFWFSSNVDHKYQVLPEKKAEANTDLNYNKLNGIDTSRKTGLDNFFNSMTIDNDGNLWMATYNAGVWKFDGKDLIHFPINSEKKEVLIFSIYNDKQGNIWLGTFNSGALKFNGKTFEQFVIEK